MPKVLLWAVIALVLGSCAMKPALQSPQPQPQALEITMPASFTQEDIDYLAVTIWAEARGEGREGMELVAHVIKNRVDSPNKRRYGTGVAGVVTKPWQFSCWNVGDPNRARCENLMKGQAPTGRDGVAWNEAKKVAYSVLIGALPDVTKGATYYHTAAVDPSWNRDMRLVARVGRHLFWVASS
jgi:N-acetylmuramoyl-L-alanine amidase